MSELLEEIRSFVAQRVAEGFDSEETIIESATEYFEDEHKRDDLRPEVTRITVELMAEHLRKQALWTKPTDCDRLDWAFAELDRDGIVARQNFSCCSNCGHGEIWDEIRQTEQEHPVEGYVFYHVQNTENACANGSLYLAYGTVKDDESALIAVGEKIAQTIERAGLRTEWNRQGNTCIRIVDLDWKRHR
jgi:hypothetical protein